MNPRRPSSASTDASSSRMPFASAEALLWGPEMKQQHAYLLTEMRALEQQHKTYDARIQQTEAAAEAAKAATARIRHLEQKLAAIQAVDDDKAFEKWASGEMTRLGIFVDTNKHVRQKQIELCNKVSHIAEDLDQLKNSPTDLRTLLRRFDLLENGRKEDARRIKHLEGEVTRLKSMSPGASRSTASSRSNTSRNEGNKRRMTPSQLSHAELSDTEATTEDEILMTPRRPTQEKIQVPRSPEIKEKSTNTTLPSSSTVGRSIMSARQRLMKRPSIHDTMLPQVMEEARQHRSPEPQDYRRGSSPPATQLVNTTRQHIAPSTGSEHEPRHHRTPNLPTAPPVNQGMQDRAPAPERGLEPRQPSARKTPATQVVSRASPRKRKQFDEAPSTQRVTRLQAKKSQESSSEQREASEARIIAFQSAQPMEQTSSSRKKLKMTPTQQRPVKGKVASGQATQVVTRSPRKKMPITVAGPSENTFLEPTQLASPKKTNRANATSSPSKKAISSPKKAAALPSKKATLSPSKKAVTKPAREQLIMILPNRRTDSQLDHLDSDYMKLSTADRVKMSPRKAAPTSPSKVPPKPVSARMNKPITVAAAGSGRHSGRADAMKDSMRSSSRTLSPEKHTVPTRNDNTGRSPSVASSTMTRNRRVIPEISHYDEFKRLQAQGDLP